MTIHLPTEILLRLLVPFRLNEGVAFILQEAGIRLLATVERHADVPGLESRPSTTEWVPEFTYYSQIICSEEV